MILTSLSTGPDKISGNSSVSISREMVVQKGTSFNVCFVGSY
jgi:hypothetical protein